MNMPRSLQKELDLLKGKMAACGGGFGVSKRLRLKGRGNCWLPVWEVADPKELGDFVFELNWKQVRVGGLF